MTNPKTTKAALSATELDPVSAAHLSILKRQRARISRTLLKRRRRKSHQ